VCSGGGEELPLVGAERTRGRQVDFFKGKRGGEITDQGVRMSRRPDLGKGGAHRLKWRREIPARE